MDWFTNFDLENVVTPVKVDELQRLLVASEYDSRETKFIVSGFKHGFDLGYKGPKRRSDTSPNIPFTVGDNFDLWSKIMKEVELKRFAGPYVTVPYNNFVQSPVGLVPKAGNKTRMIFHLSYDFVNGGKSINHWTPDHLCSVKYNDLDHAVRTSLKCIQQQGKSQQCPIFYGRTDFLSAFRVLPLNRKSWRWVIIRAKHPVTNKYFYFINKNVPFGSSISCAHFQRVSEGMRHILEHQVQKRCVTNYLDDFLFIDTTKSGCNHLVRTFMQICQTVNFPLSDDKTEWASCRMVFLGILLVGDLHCLSLPQEKVSKALMMLTFLSQEGKYKAKVGELERLAGFLNFLNKAIVPGRTFARRMYAKFSGKVSLDGKRKNRLRKYHHVRIDTEFKNDCKAWILFLNHISAVTRPFADFSKHLVAKNIPMYSDASASSVLGFGCTYGDEWTFSQWEKGYIDMLKPSIQYLELYAVCIAIFTWADKLSNGRFEIWCDNQNVGRMINTGSTKCTNCIALLRLLTINNLMHNRRIFIKYVTSADNFLADSLSRLKLKTFFQEAPETVNLQPQALPRELWPAS